MCNGGLRYLLGDGRGVVYKKGPIKISQRKAKEMKKLRCSRAVQDLLCMLPAAAAASASCLSCIGKNNTSNYLIKEEDELGEIKPLISTTHQKSAALKVKDVIAPTSTLAFHLKPKMVVLKVSMHCNGCAKRVEKHISKLEGVTSYEIDLDTKMVVLKGDIAPFEVLESVSKVKYAELWEPSHEILINSP